MVPLISDCRLSVLISLSLFIHLLHLIIMDSYERGAFPELAILDELKNDEADFLFSLQTAQVTNALVCKLWLF